MSTNEDPNQNDTDAGSCKKQDCSAASSRIALADGGATWADLTAFQRDILESIAALDRIDETTYGLAIMRDLEEQYNEVVNHGRLYPNLDTLVELGFVEKRELDGRTNEYVLTDAARAVLRRRVYRLADACAMSVAATDGGDRS